MEVVLIGLAWGPANSQGMISKGREKYLRERPEFFPNRPYALALHFRAKAPVATSGGMSMSSGIVRIEDVEGDAEPASTLTSSGFVLDTYNVNFANGKPRTDYWVFFPASTAQRGFLFQVTSVGDPVPSFKIVLTDQGFIINNLAPSTEMTCFDMSKRFAGNIGGNIPVDLRLILEGSTLSGTETYAKIGKALELKGAVDSLGNFELLEHYPKNRSTGIFKGKFSQNCRTMTGYFSKPDKSRLLPFEFRQIP